MISGRGKGAAYLRSTEASAQFVDPLEIQDRIKENKRYSQEQADKKADAKAKESKEFEGTFDLADDDFVAKVSTIKQVDDALRYASNVGYNKFLELERGSIEAQKAGDTERARILRDRAFKIKNSFKGASQIGQIMLEQVKNVQEGLKNGSISKYDSQTAMIAEAYGKKNFLPEIDENDNWYWRVLGEDGEGNKVELPNIPLEELNKPLNTRPSFDIKGFVKNHIDTAGYIEEKKADGSSYYTTTKNVDPAKKKAIELEIDQLSMKENPVFFHLFAEANGGKAKYKDFTKADEEKVKNSLLGKFKGVFDELDEKSKNDVKDAEANRTLKKKETSSKSKALLVYDGDGLKTFALSQGSKNKGLPNIDRTKLDLLLTDISVATDPDGKVRVYGVFRADRLPKKPTSGISNVGNSNKTSEVSDKPKTERTELTLASLEVLANDLRNSGENNSNLLEILDKQIEVKRGRGEEKPSNFTRKKEKVSQAGNKYGI